MFRFKRSQNPYYKCRITPSTTSTIQLRIRTPTLKEEEANLSKTCNIVLVYPLESTSCTIILYQLTWDVDCNLGTSPFADVSC